MASDDPSPGVHHDPVFRSIVEHAPQIITRIGPDLRYTYANPALGRTGRDPAALIGKLPAEIGMPDATASALRGLVAAVFATGEERSIVEAFTTETGQAFYRIRYIPERAPDGTITAVLSYADDITR